MILCNKLRFGLQFGYSVSKKLTTTDTGRGTDTMNIMYARVGTREETPRTLREETPRTFLFWCKEQAFICGVHIMCIYLYTYTNEITLHILFYNIVLVTNKL